MSHRKHVLVVDDDNMQIMIMRRIFERHGLRVSTAADGRDALLQIAAEEFDIVVTDLHMPRCDGAELIATMRQSGKLMPVIIHSSDDEGTRPLAHQDGVQILHKSGSFIAVLAAIDRAL